MTAIHFRDQQGRPVGAADVRDIDALDVAVIDGAFDRRWIVDIGRTSASCQTCSHDCRHAEQVERALKEADLLSRGGGTGEKEGEKERNPYERLFPL